MSPNNWQLPLPLTSFIDNKQDLRYRPRLNYVFISHGSSEWPPPFLQFVSSCGKQGAISLFNIHVVLN